MAASLLAETALKALTDDNFETEPGMCQRFVRQVIFAVHGPEFENYRANNAHNTAKIWRRSRYVVAPENGSQIGDILYWYATPRQPDGHVAIRVAGNRFAENSVVHRGKKNGAKGTRPLHAKKSPDLLIRLPEA